MDILAPLIVGGILMLFGKKKEKDPDNTGGSGDSNQDDPRVTGEPRIQVKKININRVLNRVQFDIDFPNGEKKKFAQSLKNGNITKIFPDFVLKTKVTGQADSKGKYDPYGVLDIALLTKDQKTVITAKRIIMENKNIIDVK